MADLIRSETGDASTDNVAIGPKRALTAEASRSMDMDMPGTEMDRQQQREEPSRGFLATLGTGAAFLGTSIAMAVSALTGKDDMSNGLARDTSQQAENRAPIVERGEDMLPSQRPDHTELKHAANTKEYTTVGHDFGELLKDSLKEIKEIGATLRDQMGSAQLAHVGREHSAQLSVDAAQGPQNARNSMGPSIPT